MNTSIKRKIKRPVVVHRPKKTINIHDKSCSMLSHSQNVTGYKKKISNLLSNNKALAQALELTHMKANLQEKYICALQRKIALQSPKLFKAKIQKVCEHLHIIVGLLEEIMEKCDHSQSEDDTSLGQLAEYGDNINDADPDHLEELTRMNMDISACLSRIPQVVIQHPMEQLRSEMPSIVENSAIFKDDLSSMFTEDIFKDMPNVNVRSKSKDKSNSSSKQQLKEEECDSISTTSTTEQNQMPTDIVVNSLKSSNWLNIGDSPKLNITKCKIPKPKSPNNSKVPTKIPTLKSPKLSKNINNKKKRQTLLIKLPYTSKHWSECSFNSPIQEKENLVSPVIDIEQDRRKTFTISQDTDVNKELSIVLTDINIKNNTNTKQNDNPVSDTYLVDPEDYNKNEPNNVLHINNEKISENNLYLENEASLECTDIFQTKDKSQTEKQIKEVNKNKILKSSVTTETQFEQENKKIKNKAKTKVTKPKSLLQVKNNTNTENLNEKVNDKKNKNSVEQEVSSVNYNSVVILNNYNSDPENFSNTNKLKVSTHVKNKVQKEKKNISSTPKNITQPFKESINISSSSMNEEIDHKSQPIIQLDDICTPVLTTFTQDKTDNCVYINDPLDGSIIKVDITPAITKTTNDTNSNTSENEDYGNTVNENAGKLNYTNRISTESSVNDNNCRRRRAATCVSYVEPSLNKKLRQGDPFTSAVNKNDNGLSKKSHKTKKSVSMKEKPSNKISDGFNKEGTSNNVQQEIQV